MGVQANQTDNPKYKALGLDLENLSDPIATYVIVPANLTYEALGLNLENLIDPIDSKLETSSQPSIRPQV